MNYKYIFLFLIGIMAVSCSDFLEVTPETNITTSNFFKSEADFEQAVSGVYVPLRDLYNNYWVLEMRSDNTLFTFDIGNRGSLPTEDFGTFTLANNNGPLIRFWQQNYVIVSRANEVIKNLENAELNQSIKDGLKGEVLFLRALAYFNLVRNFGGVPLISEPVTSLEQSFIARSTVDDVYAQIISDGSSAASLLPSKGNQDLGKATSGAALALLADVYVTLERWGEAEGVLKSITTMNYSLLADYGAIFDPSNWDNEELIFQVEFLERSGRGTGSTFPYSFIPSLNDPSVLTGVTPGVANNTGSFNVPTPDIIEAYEDFQADQRFKASIGFFTGESNLIGVTNDSMQYVNKFFFFQSDPQETSTNWPVYRYGDILLLLAESLNEQGNSTEALLYLNQVRNRAGIEDISNVDQSSLREIILDERRIELAFENKRWYDLVRTGRMVSIMNAHGAKVKADPARYTYPEGSFPPPNSFNVTAEKELLPIPIGEIEVNPLLEQNPGY